MAPTHPTTTAHLALPADVRAELERIEGEKDLAHRAFLLWVSLGPDRSLHAVIRAMGKSRGYMTQLARWVKAHEWHTRIMPVQAWEATRDGRDPLPYATPAERVERVGEVTVATIEAMRHAERRLEEADQMAATAEGVVTRLTLLNNRLANLEEYEARLRALSTHQLRIAEDLLHLLATRVEEVATKSKMTPKEFSTLLNAAERAAAAARTNISETEGVTLYISRLLKELGDAGPPAEDESQPLH